MSKEILEIPPEEHRTQIDKILEDFDCQEEVLLVTKFNRTTHVISISLCGKYAVTYTAPHILRDLLDYVYRTLVAQAPEDAKPLN